MGSDFETRLRQWRDKPALREIYRSFYSWIRSVIAPDVRGAIVEIGSGIASLRDELPLAIASDIEINERLDLACDAYDLPLKDGSISHLILFDVFHHLQAPYAFLTAARRALVPAGRLILFEPYMSALSWPVYGLFHPEPIGWREEIMNAESLPRHARSYYAGQGAATRLFFRRLFAKRGWKVEYAKALCSTEYLLSGGFSGPQILPSALLLRLRSADAFLSRWPSLFGTRCLVVLERANADK